MQLIDHAPILTRWLLGLLAVGLTGCSSRPPERPALTPPTDLIKVALTAADLQFGQQQVDQMMQDRPAMTACVQKNDRIYHWVVRQFAGKAVGQRISWSPEALANHAPEYLSMHKYPSPRRHAYIAVREKYAGGAKQGQLLPGDELWACVVFELFNIANAKDFASIYDKALDGKVSKAEFRESHTQLEFLAVQKTGQFYRKMWQPEAKQKGRRTNPFFWYALAPSTYEAWRQHYTDPSGYPYSYYDKYYDEHIVPYLQSSGLAAPSR